nr:PD-(D/E)XK nuclease family protein [Pontibacter harenae]
MAYNFYRLLQRAKRINLLYVLPSDTYGSGEKSRFILQLQNDLALRNPRIKFRDLTAAIEQQQTKKYDEDIQIEKDEQTLEQLKKELQKGLYPSHLNMYINCSLQYYFSRIAKIQEMDEVEEQLGTDKFGTLVHQVLEDFFKPFAENGKPIEASDVAQMLQQLPAKVREEFIAATRGATPDRGMNYLLYKVAIQVLEKYLTLLQQSDELPLYVLRLEDTLAAVLPVQVGDEEIMVRVAGKADRIDLTGNELRVIDYKTGKVEKSQLVVKPEEVDLHFTTDPKYDKARQLWLYQYILQRTLQQSPETVLQNAPHVVPQSITPKSGILSFRNLDAGVLSSEFNFVEADGTSPKSFIAASEDLLSAFVRRMLDPQEPIKKTNDLDVCQYCPYRGICAR